MDPLDEMRDTMLQIKTKAYSYKVEWLPESEEWTGSQLTKAYGKEAEKILQKIIEKSEQSEPFWCMFGGTVELTNGNRYQVFAKGKA